MNSIAINLVRKNAALLAAFAFIFLITPPVFADILFKDTFSNGSVANSDDISPYWTTVVDGGVSIAETDSGWGGRLTFSSSSAGTVTGDVHSAASANYAFLRPESHTMVLKDLEFSNSSELNVQLGASVLRNASDRIQVVIASSGSISLSAFNGGALTATQTITGSTVPPNEVIIVSNETQTEVIAYFKNAPGTTYKRTATITHGLTASNWDGAGGSGCLYLYWQKTASPAAATVCSIGSFEVFAGAVWKGLNQSDDAHQSKEYIYMDWSSLSNNGKSFAQKDEPSSPPTPRYENQIKWNGDNHGEVFVLKGANQSLDWDASRTAPAKNGTTGWQIENCDYVHIEDVNIKNLDTLTYNTFRIINCKEVYINNVRISGFAKAPQILIEGCESVLVERVELAGVEYSPGAGKLAGSISIDNGKKGEIPPMGLKYCVLQHNYCHDFDGTISSYGGLNVDGILVMSGKNALVFNNYIENYQAGGHGADGAFDLGHRRTFSLETDPTYGTGNVIRAERNVIMNCSTTKVGNSHSQDNEVLVCNNVFYDSYPWVYHSGYAVNMVNNTLVYKDTRGLTKMGDVGYNSNGILAQWVFRNNIFSRAATGTSAYFIYRANNTGPDPLEDDRLVLNLNHNVYMINDGINNFFDDDDYPSRNVPTLAVWQDRFTPQESEGSYHTSGTLYASASGGASGFDYRLANPSSVASDEGAFPWNYPAAQNPKTQVDHDFLGKTRGPTVTSAGAFEADRPQEPIILDNASPGVVLQGTWTASTTTPVWHGDDYLHDGNTAGGKNARFTPDLPISGPYAVYMWWTADSNRADNVPVDIVHTGGTATVSVNQKLNGGVWMLLGTYPFSAGTAGSVLVRNDGANGYVIADAVRFVLAVDQLSFEAESTSGQTLFSPFVTASDAGASGGQYISSPTSYSSTPDALTTGQVSFTCTLSGTVAIWVRMYCPGTSEDSFWASYDGGAYASFYDSTAHGTWVWKKWGEVTATGNNTFNIVRREANTRLDRVLFTKDLNFIPTGMGENGMPPDITTTSLPAGRTTISYGNQQLAATGGLPPYTWSLGSGSLPAGLSMSGGGVVSGTPTTPGSSNFTIKATGADGISDTQAFQINVTTNGAPVITTNSLPGGAVSVAYNEDIVSTGGDVAMVWSLLSGALPDGLSLTNVYLNNAAVTGTPTTIGTFNFSVKAVDVDGDQDTQALSIVISPPPPGPFSLSSPIHGATHIGTTPTFDWDDASGVTSYTLLVDNNSDFSSPEINETGILSSQFTIGTALANSTTYYWRVTAVNADGSTSASNNDFPFSTANLRIEAGSTASFTDSIGHVWSADDYVTGGTAVNRYPTAIALTDDDTLYQTERWGMTAYTIPVVNGLYTVRLHLAETSSSITGAGQRVFTVTAEGSTPGGWANMDLYVIGGNAKNVAIVRTATVWVNDGTLNLGFSASANNPLINGIEIIPGSTMKIEAGANVAAEIGGDVWSADQYFSGGAVVNRGAIAIDNTSDDTIYQTERYGMTGYAIPVANGVYTVRLHLAETSTAITGSGQRVFTITAEGAAPVGWSNIDLYAEGGGNNKALTRTTTVVVNDGMLNLGFSASVNQPLINGIEISPGARLEAGATPSCTDLLGNIYAGDDYFTGGTAVNRGAIAIDNTVDDKIYQTERYGMTGYAIPVANGVYTVRLHLAETSTAITASGQRVFTITAEGASPAEWSNIDLYAEGGGSNKALIKTTTVVVSDGTLNLGFSASVNQPLINGIEIMPGARIEAGGAASFSGPHGSIYADDLYFTGGTVADRGAVAIAETVNDRIYQTERWGMSAYAIPVLNGTYVVRLHLAETSTSITGAGQRVFTVAAEGSTPSGWGNMDLYAIGGNTKNVAIIKTAIVTVSDGTLNLGFTASANSALINGIEIVPE